MDEKEKKIGITAGLVLLSLGLLFAATAQSGDDGYELSVDTLPPEEVQSTEANFTANVTGLADEYDAALVYWNYSKDSSLDKKGPANIAFSEGEKVESLQPDLDPNANYNVEAYVEPVVWGDYSLESNLASLIGERPESFEILSFMNKVTNDADLFNTTANYTSSRTALLGGKDLINQVWDKNNISRFFFEEAGDPEEANYKTEINWTNYNTLKVTTKACCDGYRGYEIKVGSSTVSSSSSNHGWTNRTVDVSSFNGVKNLTLSIDSGTEDYGELVDVTGRGTVFSSYQNPGRYARFTNIRLN